MDPTVKRMLVIAVTLGCGLGLMLGAGVWAAVGGPSPDQVIAQAQRLGMVTAAEAESGDGFLLVVSQRSDATDIAEALRAAGMREQAKGFVVSATGKRLRPGAYRIGFDDSLEVILQRLTTP